MLPYLWGEWNSGDRTWNEPCPKRLRSAFHQFGASSKAGYDQT